MRLQNPRKEPHRSVNLEKALGKENLPRALELMKSGNLEGDLGRAIHDLFLDVIVMHAQPVWEGFIHSDGDNYPVRVNEYQGVFWVWADESDSVGYFPKKSDAISFARTNWDNVYKKGDEPYGQEEYEQELRCPYCRSTDSCEHLLLTVDKTFRQAEGGLLYEAFNARWAQILEEADDPDFDEREPFDELLDEVDSLADLERNASPDSAPGQSSDYSFFYCSTEEKVRLAAKSFSAS